MSCKVTMSKIFLMPAKISELSCHQKNSTSSWEFDLKKLQITISSYILQIKFAYAGDCMHVSIVYTMCHPNPLKPLSSLIQKWKPWETGILLDTGKTPSVLDTTLLVISRLLEAININKHKRTMYVRN